MSEAITNVQLLYIDLDNEYKHTLWFEDKNEQLTMFTESTIPYFAGNFSYQKKDSTMRVNLSLDEAMKYNYVIYQNPSHNNKYFYAFITGYEWKSETVTEIKLETDVIQTYMFDYEVKPSFIEREHTNDDTIGANTIPENLEMGEYQVKYSTKINDLTDYLLIIGVTDMPGESYGLPNDEVLKIYHRPGRYNGIYSGLTYYAFEDSDTLSIDSFIKSYSASEAIKVMFLLPKAFIERADDSNADYRVLVKKSTEPKTLDFEILKDHAHTYAFADDGYGNNFNNYQPKNNKLLTFPYIYLLVSNNNGGSAIYQYEHFTSTSNGKPSMLFKIESAITPGGSARLIPCYYKGALYNHEEGLNLGKFPIVNWTSDEFTNWLTQNSLNIGLNLASGLGQVALGVGTAIATGGAGSAIGIGTAVGGISSIVNQLTQIHQMSFTPPQANGNINCGDVITASLDNTFFFYHMSIKPEYMKVIDDFFNMFGYKTSRVKKPNKNHRENWWFTKTIDVNISCAEGKTIPIMDLQKIKSCYNNGITFWRSGANIKNYNLSNNILT